MSGHFVQGGVWDFMFACVAWLAFFILRRRLTGFYIGFIGCYAAWRALGVGVDADSRLCALLALLLYPVLWLVGLGAALQFVVGLFGFQLDFSRAGVATRNTCPSPEPVEPYQAVQISPLEQRGIPKDGIYNPVEDYLNEWQRR